MAPMGIDMENSQFQLGTDNEERLRAGDKAPSPAKTDPNFFALASTNSARLFRQAVHMICIPFLPTKRQSRAISSSKIHQINFFRDINMFMTLSPDLRQIYPTCKLLRCMLDSPFISSNSSLMLVTGFLFKNM